MNTCCLHKSFKLNDRSFDSIEELLEYSKINYKEVYIFLTDFFDSNDYISVKTSGSTGKQKVIQLKKEFLKNSALATGRYFNLLENTSALLCLSPDYIAGKMMLVRALILGWQLDVVAAISNPLENNLKEYDFSAMVPLQLFNSLDAVFKIKKLIVGGGVVSNTLQDLIQNVPTKIYATYGMTETITHIAVKRLNHFTDSNIGKLEKISQSNFNVLPNVLISKDSRGCLVIIAPKVSEKPVITNDLIDLISDVEFQWLGRFDNIINSGGIKLIPEQIEEKLSKVITNRFFVSAIPDVVLGEKLILIIEGEPYEIPIEKMYSILDKYQIPKNNYFLAEFIETETRKIDRNKTKLLLTIE